MKRKLLIVGTGNYALVASYFLTESGQYDIVGFSEEAAYRKLPDLNGQTIFEFEKVRESFDPATVSVLVAVGPNRVNSVRERLFNAVRGMGYSCIKFIHPEAYVWSEEAVGENSFIFPRAIVEPFARVGNNCVLWSASLLAHHSVVDDHCFLAPGCTISGRSVVKKNCFLGINATVRDNVIIEEKCIIGAGAIVKKNTKTGGVYSAPGTPFYNDKSFETKV